MENKDRYQTGSFVRVNAIVSRTDYNNLVYEARHLETSCSQLIRVAIKSYLNKRNGLPNLNEPLKK